MIDDSEGPGRLTAGQMRQAWLKAERRIAAALAVVDEWSHGKDCDDCIARVKDALTGKRSAARGTHVPAPPAASGSLNDASEQLSKRSVARRNRATHK